MIAFLALGQIRIAKNQLQEQKNSSMLASKRDALKLTAEQITSYCEKTIPLQNILNDKLETENIKVLENFKIEFNSECILVTPPDGDFNLEDLTCFMEEFIDVANSMESFSTYFVSGVADEKIAYLSLGSTFCNTMNKIGPIMLPISENGRYFLATLQLYRTWGLRLENEDLEKQKIEIENRLKSKKQTSTKVIGADF